MQTTQPGAVGVERKQQMTSLVSEKEIEQTCLINYGVSFPMFEKVTVWTPRPFFADAANLERLTPEFLHGLVERYVPMSRAGLPEEVAAAGQEGARETLERLLPHLAS